MQASEEKNVDCPEEQNDNDPNPQECATSSSDEKDGTPVVKETISEEGANCQESQLGITTPFGLSYFSFSSLSFFCFISLFVSHFWYLGYWLALDLINTRL